MGCFTPCRISGEDTFCTNLCVVVVFTSGDETKWVQIRIVKLSQRSGFGERMALQTFEAGLLSGAFPLLNCSSQDILLTSC
jgi:hypothetical protein